MKLKVVKLEKTCEASPAQWEGWLEDGRAIYIRHRFGRLSIRVSEGVTDDIVEAIRGREIFGMDYGGEWDGEMSLETLVELTRSAVNYDEIEVEEKAKEEK